MRFHVALAAGAFLLASVSALQAQDATTTSTTSTTPATSAAMPASPSAQTKSTPAPAAKQVVCEVNNDQGEVVPLRQCVSQDEANRRRYQQEEAIREFQQQSMSMQPH